MGGALLTLAWRPFLDPLNLHGAWYLLLLPLAFFIAMVYRAVRVPDLEGYWRKVLVLTFQIVVSMILLGLASYLIIQVVVPMLMPMPE